MEYTLTLKIIVNSKWSKKDLEELMEQYITDEIQTNGIHWENEFSGRKLNIEGDEIDFESLTIY